MCLIHTFKYNEATCGYVQVKILKQAIFSCKGSNVNIFGSVGHAMFVETTQ